MALEVRLITNTMEHTISVPRSFNCVVDNSNSSSLIRFKPISFSSDGTAGLCFEISFFGFLEFTTPATEIVFRATDKTLAVSFVDQESLLLFLCPSCLNYVNHQFLYAVRM